MLERIVDILCCPVCAGGLRMTQRTLRCAGGHSYDVAREGYVNLLAGVATGTGTADTTAMVRSRRAFLEAGHYRPLADTIARLTTTAATIPEATGDDGVIVDAGAGTGYHLAAVLDRLPTAAGLALDASKHAARRAARAHPRAAAAVWDLWQPLPVRTGTVAVVLDVFAPRNGAEYHRILRPNGVLVVVTPAADHLTELVTGLELLTVDTDKDDRLDRALAAHFRRDEHESLGFELLLSADDLEHVVAMGPSAWHVDATEIRRRIAALSPPVRVTASVALRMYRPA